MPTDGQDVIVIDKEGNWFYNGLPIVNETIYQYFNRHVVPAESGGYCLKIGDETMALEVEDTPYVVTAAELQRTESAGDHVLITLNDKTSEPLNTDTFYIQKDTNIPYCRVKNNLFPARFLRPAYYHLAEHVREGEHGEFYILLNNRKWYIGGDQR